VPWSLRNRAVTDGRFSGISSNAPGEFLRGYVNVQPKYFLLRQDFGGHDPRTEKWDPEANAYEARILERRGARYNPWYIGPAGDAINTTLPAGVTSAEAELERDRLESAEVKERVRKEPLGAVRKFFIQLVTFWYVVETRKKSLFVGAIAVVVLALAALGVRRTHRQGTTSWPVVAVPLYFNAIYAVFLAFARYSMPLYPTLIALAAGGIMSVFDALRRATPKAAATSRPGS